MSTATGRLFSPVPVRQRLPKVQAKELFLRYKGWFGGLIEIMVRDEGELAAALLEILNEHKFEKSDDEIDAIVKEFTESDEVLYCYSDACRYWDMEIDESEAETRAVFQLQITLTGWSVVSIGEDDCVSIGDNGNFLLVRDQKCAAVEAVSQLLFDAGADESVRWDRLQIPFGLTSIEERSWREIVPLLSTLIEEDSDNDEWGCGDDDPFESWSDDTPLFDVVKGKSGLTITNSNRAKFIMELFDHTQSMMRRLNIPALATQIEGLKFDKGMLQCKIDSLNSVISKQETELKCLRSAQDDTSKKRKGGDSSEANDLER